MSGGHGGNLRELARAAGRDPEQILDFSANINPLGPPPWLRQVISRHLREVAHYPDPRCSRLLQAAAAAYGVPEDMLVAGNGSSELLHVLPACAGADRGLVLAPAYIDYARVCRVRGLALEYARLDPERDFAPALDALAGVVRKGDLVFLGRPNNPTGRGPGAQAIRDLARAHAGRAVFVVDEAFWDFCPPGDSLLPELPANVVLLRSLTKFFAIPGLRLGLAVARPELVRRLREQLPAWSVNTLAQRVGARALRDGEYAARTRAEVARLRGEFGGLLRTLPGLRVFPSQANYLLLRLPADVGGAAELNAFLLREHGLAVRVCDNYEGLDASYLRVAVRPEQEQRLLVEAIAAWLWASRRGRAPAGKTRRPPDPASGGRRARGRGRLMVQGTGSNVGKSLMVAALCRILLQEGLDVVPFKAQNMALNSFVTADGEEMGRAQVLQARACRLPPDVRMNPILLKPCSDTGCQVIRMGRPAGTMAAGDYLRDRSPLFAVARRAFDELAAEHEVVLLEGAGSPAEVNLKHRDIVNMRMARHARSPVLLVGDIDRGGVYAAFIGTLAVMEEWERALVAGFVVNKFRGDASLLAPAHACVYEYTGKPVLGVVPWIEDHGLPEEDSVSFKQRRTGANPSAGTEAVELAVLDLPHISNFTDLDALRLEPDVRVRVVRRVEELDSAPAAVVIPGTRNVIGDLRWMRERGWCRRLREFAAGGTSLVGICGGLQMLGRDIRDPLGLEGRTPEARGLGLLPLRTHLAAGKILRQARGRHLPSGHALKGYEIHHGRTDAGAGARAVIESEDGEVVGYGRPDGLVWGTYLHGVFDADEFRRWFIDELRARCGFARLGRVQAVYDLDAAIDRLAATVRSGIDIRALRRVMRLA